jgi:1-deoxy-D-xylulose-5-phosphate synthase
VTNVQVRRLGIPDQFIEHGARGKLLEKLGIDSGGIAATARNMIKGVHDEVPAERELLYRRN